MNTLLIIVIVIAALFLHAVAALVIALGWMAHGEPDWRRDPERDGGIIK